MIINKLGVVKDLIFDNKKNAIKRIENALLPKLYKILLPFRYVYGRKYNKQNSIFIDCGANTGDGFKYFSRIFPTKDFTYHFFEPNPYCIDELKKVIKEFFVENGFEVFQNAAWIKKETLSFYGIEESGDQTTLGGSVVKEHNTMYYASDESSALEVESVDFLEYLVEIQEKYENIFLKMDIETAELDVLEYLWKNKEKLFRKMVFFVEFHAAYQVGDARKEAQERENFIVNNSPKNVTLYKWI